MPMRRILIPDKNRYRIFPSLQLIAWDCLVSLMRELGIKSRPISDELLTRCLL